MSSECRYNCLCQHTHVTEIHYSFANISSTDIRSQDGLQLSQSSWKLEVCFSPGISIPFTFHVLKVLQLIESISICLPAWVQTESAERLFVCWLAGAGSYGAHYITPNSKQTCRSWDLEDAWRQVHSLVVWRRPGYYESILDAGKKIIFRPAFFSDPTKIDPI